jgi:outer membrane immunogenic protein
MIRHLIAAPLLLGAIASPALAADPEPFSGPRVEAIGGYDEGFVYGVAAGYDLRSGGIVIGLDAEATDSTAKECVSGLAVPGDRLCALAGRDLFVGGRIGVPVGARVLIYAKGGYSNARQTVRYVDPATSANSFDVSADLDGVRAAGGIELGLGKRVFVKGEYRYTNYEAGNEKHDAVVGLGIRF